ncbi:hypothetical protein FB567DRAFT_552925 [Paraphoma chrysanthemicola]|uniref:Uncharacterized protein n=1 Tax=Paraphoma chrysanthemicola TaxID=798071 RepID=A0A8K0VU94_9PLEO|nr:hypothetical protein FB567DRAFT_552925 [Paraphoma chrysanthemicola]
MSHHIARIKSFLRNPLDPFISDQGRIQYSDDVREVQQHLHTEYPFPLDPCAVRKARHDFHPDHLPEMAEETWKVRYFLYRLLTSRRNDCAKEYPAWVLETCIAWEGRGFELRHRTSGQLMDICPIKATALNITSKRHKPGMLAPIEARAMIGTVVAHFVENKKKRERQFESIQRHLQTERHRIRDGYQSHSRAQSAQRLHGIGVGMGPTLSLAPQSEVSSLAPSHYSANSVTGVYSTHRPTTAYAYQIPSVAGLSRPSSCPPTSLAYRPPNNNPYQLNFQSSNSSSLSTSARDSVWSSLSSSTIETSPTGSVESPFSESTRRLGQSQQTTIEASRNIKKTEEEYSVEEISILPEQRPQLKRMNGLRHSVSLSDRETLIQGDMRTSSKGVSVRGASATRTQEISAKVSSMHTGQPIPSRLARSSSMRLSAGVDGSSRRTSGKHPTLAIPERISEEPDDRNTEHGRWSRAPRHDSAGDGGRAKSQPPSGLSNNVNVPSLARAVSRIGNASRQASRSAEDSFTSGNLTPHEYKSWNAPRSHNELPIAKKFNRPSPMSVANVKSSETTPKYQEDVPTDANKVKKTTSFGRLFEESHAALQRLKSTGPRGSVSAPRSEREPARLFTRHSDANLSRQTGEFPGQPRRPRSIGVVYSPPNPMEGHMAGSSPLVHDTTLRPVNAGLGIRESGRRIAPPPRRTCIQIIEESERAKLERREAMQYSGKGTTHDEKPTRPAVKIQTHGSTRAKGWKYLLLPLDQVYKFQSPNLLETFDGRPLGSCASGTIVCPGSGCALLIIA